MPDRALWPALALYAYLAVGIALAAAHHRWHGDEIRAQIRRELGPLFVLHPWMADTVIAVILTIVAVAWLPWYVSMLVRALAEYGRAWAILLYAQVRVWGLVREMRREFRKQGADVTVRAGRVRFVKPSTVEAPADE